MTYIGEKIGDKELTSVVKSANKDILSEYLWGKDILDLLAIDPNYQFNIVKRNHTVFCFKCGIERFFSRDAQIYS